MVALKIQNFGGMLPAVDPHLLPEASAEYSENTWLESGAVQGFYALKKIYTPVDPTAQYIFRIPIEKTDSKRIPNSYWLEFQTPNVDVVQAPTDNDSFERFYWTSDAGDPQYNTKTRIANGDPPFVLGIPAPTAAPGVTVVGGTGPTESRAYVYTWVSAYGEESPPSPPTLFAGNSDGSWDLTLTAPGAVATDRNLDLVRIYRTVSGVGGETDYFFVDEQSIATLTYSDVITSVTGNAIIESVFWTPPPADLVGFVTMANGIIAGWKDNEIWFCEPYRPHAWPVTYQVTVDSDVVGCAVFNQTLVVCTQTYPFLIYGVNPGSMSVSRLPDLQPCTSRHSVLSVNQGVVYTSPDGLVMVSPNGAQVVSKQMVSRDKWADYLDLKSIHGAALGDGYYCFGSTQTGCFEPTAFETVGAFVAEDFSGSYSGGFLNPQDPRVGFTVLTSATPVRSVTNDSWTDEVFVMLDDGLYWLEETVGRSREEYLWRSKILETPNERNFEAMRVYFDTIPGTPELINPRVTDLVQTLGANQWGLVRVYADGVLRMTRELRKSGEFFRLPSGFKATFWQIELEARVRVKSVEIATSARELRNV